MENNKQNKTKNLWLNAIVVFVILLILLTIVGSLNDIEQIFTTIKTLSLNYVLIAILLSILSFLTLTLSNYIVLRALNKNISKLTGFFINGVEPFFNGITPFSSGAQPFQIYYYRKHGVPSNEATSVLIVNFILFQLTSVLISTVGIIVFFNDIFNAMQNNIIYIIIGYSINSIILVGLFLLAYVKSAYKLFEMIFIFFEKFKIFKKTSYKLRIKTEKFVGEFQNGVKFLFTKKRVFVLSSLTKLVSLTLLYSTTIFIVLALGKELEIYQYFYIFFISNLAVTTMMFIPLPGASGGTEIAFSLLMAGLLSSIEIVSVMLMWRFVTYYFGMLLGLISFIILKTRRVNTD
ncbi:lysylphosphatidylglycerol synthase transmembrane domain-containing protein [Acholeplasma granularum]|uniref:lysylphosphatidylglycerol synthase transmembrane domain-containing protein n=1 Tax=Acholeplasma granularum TaxID=264635 RepID=UPI0004ADF8AD|nr:lysylphosphatidylglycerol synthase transmembrane domain-containing protein [Acholeplasma granularum]